MAVAALFRDLERGDTAAVRRAVKTKPALLQAARKSVRGVCVRRCWHLGRGPPLRAAWRARGRCC